MMGKIFRRRQKTLVLEQREKKKDDEHARKRNVVVNFRVSPEEKRLLDARIALSGLSRSSFFIESCLFQAVLVKANVKNFDAINIRMREIYEVMEKKPELKEIDGDLVESWRMILEILEELYGQ